MRRNHRKSRQGCKVCKQRHIKCDESKPSCANCLIVGRKCSYLHNLSALPPPTVTSRQSSRSSSSTSSRTHHETTPQPVAILGMDYALTHLELFHHFENHLGNILGPDPGVGGIVIKRAIQESFKAPYLMDELLAFSAAHKSILDPSRKHIYLTEATNLQTRGLSRFNAAQAKLSDDNCMAIFMFSVILGYHVLFDTFLVQNDFTAFMSKMVHCLRLHRGIHIIAFNSWKIIHKELFNCDSSYLESVEPVKPGDQCAPLLDLLDESELGEKAKEDCREAVNLLQFICSRQRTGTSQITLPIQEWAVRIPAGYVELLNQLQPEALVILAYYATLLHYCRSYWTIGDAGAYLIRSINDHLGGYFARWLEWPNQVVAADSTHGSAADYETVA